MQRQQKYLARLLLTVLTSLAFQTAAHAGGRQSEMASEQSAPVKKVQKSQTLAAIASGPKTHTVLIEYFKYHPNPVTVRKGDKIVFINKDFVPHTATSRNGVIDSGKIQTDGQYLYTTTKVGTFELFCEYHPNMLASMQVM